MTTNKTTLTPAEHANASQAHQFLDSLTAFRKNEADTTINTVLASKVAREPLSVEEIIVHLVDPGDGGANSDTFIDVKKNGVTILSAPIGVADEADADTVVFAYPASDALAKLDPGDILTIETGADLGDVFVGLSVEARIAKRYDTQAEIPILRPNI